MMDFWINFAETVTRNTQNLLEITAIMDRDIYREIITLNRAVIAVK